MANTTKIIKQPPFKDAAINNRNSSFCHGRSNHSSQLIEHPHILPLFLHLHHLQLLYLPSIAYMLSSTRPNVSIEPQHTHIAHFEGLGNDLHGNCFGPAVNFVHSFDVLRQYVFKLGIDICHCLLSIINNAFILNVWSVCEVITFSC